MGMQTFAKIEGLKHAQEQFHSLSDKMQRKVLRDTMRNAGRIVVKDARRRAPRGKTGELKKSIAIKVSVKKAISTILIGIKRSSRARFYAHLVEFGTVHSPPKPFMRPAFDSGKRSIVESVAKGLNKTIARVASKA